MMKSVQLLQYINGKISVAAAAAAAAAAVAAVAAAAAAAATYRHDLTFIYTG